MRELINNLPQYATECKYIVAREVGDDRELWFYGAYDDRNFANEVAIEIQGVVIQ